MKTEITTEQLNNYLNQQINNSLIIKSYQAFNSFSLLLNTGIRAEEIDTNLWEKRTDGNFELIPQKRNNARIFSPSEIPILWQNAVINQNPIFYTNSYSTLLRAFHNTKNWTKIYIYTKEISIHLYRHLYARNLKELGLTDEQIKDKMGEKKQSSADSYIYGKLFSNI